MGMGKGEGGKEEGKVGGKVVEGGVERGRKPGDVIQEKRRKAKKRNEKKVANEVEAKRIEGERSEGEKLLGEENARRLADQPTVEKEDGKKTTIKGAEGKGKAKTEPNKGLFGRMSSWWGD